MPKNPGSPGSQHAHRDPVAGGGGRTAAGVVGIAANGHRLDVGAAAPFVANPRMLRGASARR